MKGNGRILLDLGSLVLLVLLFVGVAGAVSVEVICTPDTISPGDSTTITVTCDKDASGSITITTPGGSSSSVDITISAGESVSEVYPDQFPDPAGTNEIGQYEVAVDLSGEKFKATFCVFFNTVIPAFPMVGTAGAAIAALSSLGLHVIKRRRLE